MCCFLWMCSTARKKYSQLQTASLLSLPANPASASCLPHPTVCFLLGSSTKNTPTLIVSPSERPWKCFFFSSPLSKGTDTDYLLVWQLQLAAAMDGIIRQIPTVERRSVSSPGDIQQNPSRATWETLFPGLIWLKRCSRDISSETQGCFIMAALFFFFSSFLPLFSAVIYQTHSYTMCTKFGRYSNLQSPPPLPPPPSSNTVSRVSSALGALPQSQADVGSILMPSLSRS